MASKYPSLSPYTYCANNPVKLVDPNGGKIEITTTTNENGNTSVHIKYTGILNNKSSQKYTKKELNILRNTISNSIEEKYSGDFGDGVIVTTSVDVILMDEKKIENFPVDRDRHQINLVDAVSDKNNIAEAKIGGSFINICSNIGKGDNSNDFSRTIAHEFGHLIGLEHVNLPGNLMNPGQLGVTLTSNQIKEAISCYNNNRINTGIPSIDTHRRAFSYKKNNVLF